MQSSCEVQLLLKTTADCLKTLQQMLTKFHSFDIPEWLCWPVKASPPAYERWVS
ncbi:divalent cation tolerance protein CutA [Synechococcus sp. M16CYN]|uniref:divalent cation tolerance protein CutA n=1 Tax=Synechococcus sp. M16CYN TaxID=3103139 RepID=UPI00333F66B8